MKHRSLVLACCALLSAQSLRSQTAASDPISGTWTGDIGLDLTTRHAVKFDLKLTGASTITGTVTQFNWTNPHASFRVDVADAAGKVESWAIEMNSPNNLIHQGWKRSTIKNGDKVTVKINPLRDGRPGGLYIGITLPDGKYIGAAPPETKPADGAKPNAY